MIKQESNIVKKISFLLFLIFFFIGIFTFKDYGISVDEEFQRKVGFYWLNYLLNFTPFEELNNLVALKLKSISDFTLPSIEHNSFYGVIFDLPLAFFEVVFKIDDPKEYFELRHLINFLLFFISSIFFYKLLLNRFANYYIALIGTLFFVLSPRIYGSSFFNNKDLVFLSLLTIALFYCFKSLDKITYKNLLIFSFFSAICTSSRILGILLPLSFVFFYALSFLSKKENINYLVHIIFFCFTYYIFLTMFWPTLWADPIGSFFSSFKYFIYMGGDFNQKVFFNGEFINANFLPNSYIFTWILISTPILYIILFIYGYFEIFKRFVIKFINVKENSTNYDFWNDSGEKKDLFILFNITAIIFFWVTFSVILYTGWRQLYFINIFLIYICAFSIYKIDLNLKSEKKKRVQFGVIAFYLIFILYKMIEYHPYQNLYFNSFFNNHANKKFEIDYWGLSGKNFLEDVLALEKNKSLIKVGVASFLPLERSKNLINKQDRKKIIVVGQDYQNADYLYSNYMSEVDKNYNNKYEIPSNFIKIKDFTLDNIKIYEIYKKKRD